MWTSAHTAVCRRHPDLIAVHQGTDGETALLLRQTFLPLPEERGHWLADTCRVARAVINDLRAAGLTGPISVLQWRSARNAAPILRRWTCRYDGDPERRAQLTDIARTRLADEGWPASPPSALPGEPVTPDWRPSSRLRFVDWYRDMTPSWLEVEPALRRQLILCTHRWVVERVLIPMSRGELPATDDLQPTGRLSWMLVRTIPVEELELWKPWIRLVRADLQRALSWALGKRTESWIRWLFLIPYAIPMSGRRDRPGDPRAAAAGEG
ncbi:MAG TPA: hypothetical protein VGV13_22170 [Methylomirabilota bacterium]|jgi:hypothetical protein|nr:hypothetical protein [Methylomirabilota bacterium]